MTIRLSTKTKAALDIFAAKLTAQQKKNVTTDEAVWELLKKVDSEATKIAERNAKPSSANGTVTNNED